MSVPHVAPITPLSRVGEFWNGLQQRFDALLSSPEFRRWAVSFPLTRPIARRRARDLFDLCAGFVYSQVLLACIRVDLFEHLRAGGVMNADAVADRIGLDADATRRLLAAAVSLRLVARRGEDGFALGPLGAAVLAGPGIADMVRHHAMLYEDLADPLALLRGESRTRALASYWGYADAARRDSLDCAEVAPYSALMATSLDLIAQEVLDAYPVERHSCLLDVGGGAGAFLAAAGARAPGLELMLFDLPQVAGIARRNLESRGLARRATVHGGDFFRDPLPSGADLISLVRVLHDHDDDAARHILSQARRALQPGGALLLAEPMAGTRGAEAMGDAYFGFYLLAMGSGRPRRREEIAAMLTAAGFDRVKSVGTYTPMLARVMVAS